MFDFIHIGFEFPLELEQITLSDDSILPKLVLVQCILSIKLMSLMLLLLLTDHMKWSLIDRILHYLLMLLFFLMLMFSLLILLLL